jgi:hypothetical protein
MSNINSVAPTKNAVIILLGVKTMVKNTSLTVHTTCLVNDYINHVRMAGLVNN